jgi:iron complex transport system ATP-binding protein
VMRRAGQIVGDGKKSDLVTAERLSGLFGRGIQVSERGGYLNAW